MSNSEFNDNKLIISSGMSQAEKLNHYEVIHKPPSSTYAYINPEPIRNSHRQLTDKNAQRTQFVFINNDINNRSPLKRILDDIPDYTTWSFFNLICCSFLFGIWAMIMSHKTKEKKSQNDFETARETSRITVVLNTFATIFGSITIIIYILRYSS